MAKGPVIPEKLERWPVDRLVPYERNSRTHSPEQVAQIAASIAEFGFTNPILVASDAGIIAGHGRLEAAKQLGLPEVPVVVLDHLSDVQRRAYVIADNQLALNAGWDDELLKAELIELGELEFDLSLMGWSTDQLVGLEEDQWVSGTEREQREFGEDDGTRTEEEEAEEEDRSNDGALLALAEIAINEPKHQVEKGDIWKVGNHLLFASSVMTDWDVWAKYLNGTEVVFCPYPGPFVPLGLKAKDYVLIMVQPDTYVAGHVLDRYVEVHGEASVQKAGAAA